MYEVEGMKCIKKKIVRIVVQLVICLCFALLVKPENVKAAFSPERLTVIQNSGNWVNPLCEDWVEKDDNSEIEIATYAQESEEPSEDKEYMPFEEAVEYLKGELKKRSENIGPFSFYVEDSAVEDELFWDLLHSKVDEHTGVSTEGDTLIWEPLSLSYNCSYSYDGLYFWVTFEVSDIYYCSTDEQEKETVEAIQTVMDTINLNEMSDYDKIFTIYDYICSHVSYDYDNTSSGSDSEGKRIAHSAYGAIVRGKAVCQGYALLLYRMLLEAGIDNRIIIGANHAWNQVKLGDYYYNCDATFDAYNPENSNGNFSSFMCGLSEYRREGSHHMILNADFQARYPVPIYGFFSDKKEITYLPDEEIAAGNCGENLDWRLTGDGTLTISGSGEMSEFEELDSPWNDVREQIKHIVIEAGVTSIGKYAFFDCYMVEDVSIADTVTGIGDYAFSACDRLRTLFIPDSVTKTGSNVCEFCIGLKEIRFSRNMKEISDYFCNSCYSLQNVELFEGTETIGEEAFGICRNMVEIDLPDSVQIIKRAAFNNAFSLEQDVALILPKGLKEIQVDVFFASRLKEIQFPESLSIIGENACSRMNWITTISIPDTVVQIDDGAFSLCLRLKEIQFGSGNVAYGSGVFGRCYTLEEVSLPDNMKEIPQNMFAYDSALKKVHIPEGVTNIGDGAFESSGISSITLPNNLTTVGERAFAYCGLEEVILPEKINVIKEEAFTYCVGLKKAIFMGDAPDTIGESSFYNTSTWFYYPQDNDTWSKEKIETYDQSHSWHGYEIDEDGHAWPDFYWSIDATCTEDGGLEWQCIFCGESKIVEVYPATGHSYGEWVTVIEATEYEEGLRQKTCTNCGDVVEETIPALRISIGDVNQDGVVDMSDLRLILQFVCNKTEFSEQQIQLADVVEDGEVDIKDLRQVLRFVCGKIEEL